MPTLPAAVHDLGSFRRRLVVLTAALGALVALTLVGVVALVVERTSASALDTVLVDRADAVVAAAAQSRSALAPVVPDARLDPRVAVYDGAGRLVAGEPAPSLAGLFDELSAVTTTRSREAGEDYRVLAEPFTTPAGARGVVVLAEPLAPYEKNVSFAVAVSAAAGALIVVLGTLLAAWASRRALEPVADMARTAEQWSERDLDRRFDLGPPTDEIRALGHTLDGLLDKVAGAIVAEQRLTSELAHELRSPLTAALTTAELVADRDDLDATLREDVDDILASCREMAATVTGLLDLARATAAAAEGSTCRLRDVLEAICRDLDGADRVALDVAADVQVAAPHAVAARALAPVLGNAVTLAEHVRVSLAPGTRAVGVLVSDDGPGVADAVVPSLFEPGRSARGGSGLGLALARRVARSVGGDVVLRETAPGGGATFEVVLPAARPAQDTRLDEAPWASSPV